MEAQRESFIFHMEYIEGVPEELEAQYAMYAINYARYGKEPELTDWRDIRMWNKTKQRIDEEAEKYEKRCSNLKNHKKTDTESTPSRDRIETESATENEQSSGVYVSEYEFVNEFENESDFDSDAPKVPVKESLPLQAYAQKIFDIFKNAGLPCAKGNFISFLQRDFKNGMAYIHKNIGNIHSDDVIGACENYAKTVNDLRSFITGKYSFERFVAFKNFIDYLPANYQPENFIDRKAQGGTSPPVAKKWQEECPDCKAKALEYSNTLEKYVCNNCGNVYTYEQITGG